MNERISPDELYNVVTAAIIGAGDKKKYIQKSLIPRMDGHRGRLQPQTSEDVVGKLFSVEESKPGEAWEIIEEMVRSGRKLTPELALEIADVAYYTLQANCPSWARNPEPFIDWGLGIPMDGAYAFCILKYEMRILQDEVPNSKEVERELMTRFLKDQGMLEIGLQG